MKGRGTQGGGFLKMTKYKNEHLRKQRHTVKDWLKYIAHLDKRDWERELTQRQIIAAYREIQNDLDYYYAAFQSPCRNCSGAIQELQGLQVEAFERAVSRLLGG